MDIFGTDYSIIKCPLCGFEFNPNEQTCHAGCSLHKGCTLIRCPNCYMDIPNEGPVTKFVRKVLGIT